MYTGCCYARGQWRTIASFNLVHSYLYILIIALLCIIYILIITLLCIIYKGDVLIFVLIYCNSFHHSAAVHKNVSTVANSGKLVFPDPMKSNDEGSVILLIPNGSVGAVIGKGGSVLREITARSHANVDVEKATTMGDDPRRISLSGTIEALELAQHIISSCIASKGGPMKSSITIPFKAVGHVIGKAGSRINDIMTRTRAFVKILPSEGEVSTDVLIEGSVMNIIAAQRAVRQVADEVRTRSGQLPNARF